MLFFLVALFLFHPSTMKQASVFFHCSSGLRMCLTALRIFHTSSISYSAKFRSIVTGIYVHGQCVCVCVYMYLSFPVRSTFDPCRRHFAHVGDDLTLIHIRAALHRVSQVSVNVLGKLLSSGAVHRGHPWRAASAQVSAFTTPVASSSSSSSSLNALGSLTLGGVVIIVASP